MNSLRINHLLKERWRVKVLVLVFQDFFPANDCREKQSLSILSSLAPWIETAERRAFFQHCHWFQWKKHWSFWQRIDFKSCRWLYQQFPFQMGKYSFSNLTEMTMDCRLCFLWFQISNKLKLTLTSLACSSSFNYKGNSIMVWKKMQEKQLVAHKICSSNCQGNWHRKCVKLRIHVHLLLDAVVDWRIIYVDLLFLMHHIY